MYRFWGKVRKDKQRGKSLGFPTANLNLHRNIPEGIYISKTKVQKKIYPSITFAGKVKTFNEQEYKSETFILDFDRNIYNHWISVSLLKKIRSNKKFNSEKELIKQMKKDEEETRNFFPPGYAIIRSMGQKGNTLIITVMGIALIAIMAGSFYYFRQNIKRGFSQPQSSFNTIIRTQSEDYTIPILKEYNPATFGRNLWLYSSDGLKSKRITSNHEIEGIYGFSPDKQRILIATTKLIANQQRVESHIGLINISNRQIAKLFKAHDENSYIHKIHWLDNSRIIYALGRKIKIYDISSNSEEVLIDTEQIITDATSIDFELSPNKEWLVYYYAGNGLGDPPQQDLNTYSLNLNNKTQTILFTQGYFYTLNNNFVIFPEKGTAANQPHKIKAINYEGLEEKMITETPSGDLVQVSSTKTGDKLFYQLSSNEPKGARLYLYDSGAKQTSMFYSVKIPDGIRNLTILPDEDRILFSAALDENQPLKHSLILYNLKTGNEVILSEDDLK